MPDLTPSSSSTALRTAKLRSATLEVYQHHTDTHLTTHRRLACLSTTLLVPSAAMPLHFHQLALALLPTLARAPSRRRWAALPIAPTIPFLTPTPRRTVERCMHQHGRRRWEEPLPSTRLGGHGHPARRMEVSQTRSTLLQVTRSGRSMVMESRASTVTTHSRLDHHSTTTWLMLARPKLLRRSTAPTELPSSPSPSSHHSRATPPRPLLPSSPFRHQHLPLPPLLTSTILPLLLHHQNLRPHPYSATWRSRRHPHYSDHSALGSKPRRPRRPEEK